MMLEKILRWVVIASAFTLPFIVLIVSTSMFFPYITGKNFAFRIIVEIMSGAWLALALVSDRYRPRRSWVLGAFALFVLVMAIADAQGAYPFKSFWSNYERMDGWVTLIHALAYVVVTSSVLLSEKIWRVLFQTSLGVSLFVSIYGFLQLGGLRTLGEGGQSGLSARVDATFGNPIYLAAYMLFHIFIAALLWYQMWMAKPAGRRLVPSLMYGTIIGVDTIVLLFTGTRGTTLGLIGGAAISVLLLAFLQGTRKTRTIAIASIVAIIVLAVGLKLGQDTALVKKVGFLERLATISLNDSTTKSRLLNMGIAWHGVTERPVFGWGQENYAIVFDKYYDPRMYAQEPWFDRVHNSIFDWLVAGGFIGLFAYLSIFAALLWAIWKRNAFAVMEQSILTGLLAGYFCHNLFVFDNVTSWILFGTVMAYIIWRAYGEDRGESISTGRVLPESALPFITAGVVLLTWGVGWFVNANALAANRILINALQPQQEGVTKNLEYFKRSIAYGTYGMQEAREQLSQAAVQIAGAQNVSNDVKNQFLNTAASEMQLQEQASPLDARFPLFLGILLDTYGNYKEGSAALQRAHELSPQKQSILYQLAVDAQARNDMAGAIQYYKTAFELLPENNEARLLYAQILIRAGKDALADEVLAPIIPTGGAADTRIAAVYVERNRYDKIITIWEAYTASHPDDAQGYFTLAAAYFAYGDKNKSISSLQRAEHISAAVAQQAEQYIQQIRSGATKIQ